MSGRQSAYATLGLRPGADRAQIDEAYRRLIKLHHPDRSGGDAERAAEINRAYRELRERPPEPPPIRMRPASPPPRRRRLRAGPVAAIAVVIGGLLLLSGRTGTSAARLWSDAGRLPFVSDSPASNAAGLVAFDNLQEPLSNSAIDRSIADAVRLHREGSAASMLEYSQTCQAQLRNHPSVIWFDTCAAYDEAIIFLEDQDPLRDPGPFGATEVTSREMGGARLLSDDAIMAESRIHQIREHVMLVLLSQAEAAQAAAVQAENSEQANTQAADNQAESLDAANLDAAEAAKLDSGD